MGAGEMDDPEVIARVDGAVGRLILNRPKALHALTFDMCGAMIDALLAWRADARVHTVLIDHAGGRGFCAGGDVRAAAADPVLAKTFFRTEYQLDGLLFSYPKPVVVVMDGVTMGGGVGVALPARYRIATERTVLAMPEGAIGLFPDVGAAWRLARLPGSVGIWMALTGARLGLADCMLLGLATDYAPSVRAQQLKALLIAEPERFEEHLTELEGDPGDPPLSLVRDDIDRLFGHPTLEAVVEALRADRSEWAKAQLAAVERHSPTTLKVAFRQIHDAARLERFEDQLAVDYRLASRIAGSHDFAEGVRAVLVDKDNRPTWRPATIEAVDPAALDALFAPLPPEEEWRPVG